jgi:hypothetical protein
MQGVEEARGRQLLEGESQLGQEAAAAVRRTRRVVRCRSCFWARFPGQLVNLLFSESGSLLRRVAEPCPLEAKARDGESLVNFVEWEFDTLVEAAGLREHAGIPGMPPQCAFTAQRWPKTSWRFSTKFNQV